MIAAVSKGKFVVVGKNKEPKDGDHDFSKVSVIPDSILAHSIPEEHYEESEYNKDIAGKWYSLKFFYSV